MSKKIAALLLIFTLIATLPMALHAQEQTSAHRILMLYQERNFFADQRDTVTVIEELLSAYDTVVADEAIANVSTLNLDNYDMIVVIALDQTIESSVLLERLTAYKGRLIWLGGSVAPLLEAAQYPLAYKGENYQYVYVDYANEKQAEANTFLIGEKRLFYEVESLSKDNRIYSWLSDGLHQSPFIVEARNLTYVSRVDMNEPLFFIFAAYLTELLPRKGLPDAELMLSLQDVHGFSDFVKLKAIADKLAEGNRPFTVQVIPYFKLSGSKKIYSYREIPQFVETLKYLEARGGSLIVESKPVEIGERQITAIGYEEALGLKSSSLKTYLNAVFLDMAEDGLKPIGYSSPHANLSIPELAEMRAHINTFIGIRYITEGQSVIYPFVLENSKGFKRFYPLNLGYLDYNNPAIWTYLDETFNKLAIVPEPFYGLYFTPDVNLEFLDQLDAFVQRKGLDYFNLAEEPIRISFENVTYDTALAKPYEYLDSRTERSVFQNYIYVFSNGVLSILVLGVGGFFFIYRRSLKRTRALARKE